MWIRSNSSLRGGGGVGGRGGGGGVGGRGGGGGSSSENGGEYKSRSQ